MTWLVAIASFVAVIAVTGGLWWATAPDRVLKRQLAAQSRRAGDVEPTEFSHGLDIWP